MKRTSLMVLAAVAGALLLGACGREVAASGNVGRGPASGDAIELVATDEGFSTETIRAGAGEEVTVEVANRGDAVHNFVVEELNLSTGDIAAGKVATATFEMPDSAVEFVCSYHGNMKGELVPEDA